MTAPKPKVLLIEDEKTIRRFVRAAVEEEGCAVAEAETLAGGLIEAGVQKPDLLILDLGLPDGNGIDLIRDLRGWSEVPVLILSARSQENDKIDALDAGADDYLTKPFEYPELAARIKALLRRSMKAASDVVSFGPAASALAIDLSAQTVTLAGEPLELTAFEFRLLEFLVRERARVVSKQELADYLYPHDQDRDSNVLEVLIGRLRRKLDPAGTLQPIETLRGRGYRFTLQPVAQ